MASRKQSQRIRVLFRVGVAAKGIDGLIELVAGAALLSVTPDYLRALVSLVTRHELSEDPRDFVANHLVAYLHAMSVDTQKFAAVYLIGHGIIKLILASALWRELRWSYPFALALMAAFVAYQLYRFAHTLSPTLALFTAVDLFIIWAVWRDYRLDS